MRAKANMLPIPLLRAGVAARRRVGAVERAYPDIDHRLHSDVGSTVEGTLDGHRLIGIAADSNTDQALGPDDAVGGIEFNPTGPRQVDFDPGMRVSGAGVGAVQRGVI